MVDDFSKMTLLQVVGDRTSKTIANAFLERVLSVYGKPGRVRTDGGPEFQGDFHALLESLAVQHYVTTPHSPWTNGIAERMVRFVKGLLRKALVGRGKEEWVSLVPWV